MYLNNFSNDATFLGLMNDGFRKFLFGERKIVNVMRAEVKVVIDCAFLVPPENARFFFFYPVGVNFVPRRRRRDLRARARKMICKCRECDFGV